MFHIIMGSDLPFIRLVPQPTCRWVGNQTNKVPNPLGYQDLELDTVGGFHFVVERALTWSWQTQTSPTPGSMEQAIFSGSATA